MLMKSMVCFSDGKMDMKEQTGAFAQRPDNFSPARVFSLHPRDLDRLESGSG